VFGVVDFINTFPVRDRTIAIGLVSKILERTATTGLWTSYTVLWNVNQSASHKDKTMTI